MTLLKNTLYNFNSIKIGNYIIQDYSRNKINDIQYLPESSNPLFITHVSLEDNQTIEGISYTLYGSENYWDILLAINGIDPLFGMTYDFDTISDISQAKVDDFALKFGPTLLQSSKDRLLEQWSKEQDETNEGNRTFKVILPNRITDFIKILSDLGYIRKA